MIEENYFWINVLCLALGTIFIRVSIIAMSSKLKISDRYKELFSYIPAAILPAFIVPAAFFHQGQISWLFEKERLIVLVAAVVVSYKSKSTLSTISFGLIALFVVTKLLG